MRTAVIQILNSKQTSKLDMYNVKQHKNEVTVTSPSKLMKYGHFQTTLCPEKK